MAFGKEVQAELLSRCARHDAAALRTLYDEFAPQLFAVLLRILHRKDLAEEALQDVFLNIWRNATSYQPSRGSPMAWMISIARYRALDIRRSSKHEIVSEEYSDLAIEHLPAEQDTSHRAGLDMEADRLKDCIGTLSSQQSQCIQLAFIGGLTHDEIASKLASPIGTVKSWVRRGLRALRECLDR